MTSAIIGVDAVRRSRGDRPTDAAEQYAGKAVALFKRILSFMGDPAITPPKYEPTMASQDHSITMILINVAMTLKQVSDDPALDAQIDESIDRLVRFFIHPEFPEWFGYLHRDGTVAQTAKGNIFKGPFHIPRMLIRTETFLV